MSFLSPTVMVSWKLSIPYSPPSNKTMSSPWSTWGITSDHSKDWTTGRCLSLLWRMRGAKIWQTSWKIHWAQKLPKVDYTYKFCIRLMRDLFFFQLCHSIVLRIDVRCQRSNAAYAGVLCSYMSTNELTLCLPAGSCEARCHEVPGR